MEDNLVLPHNSLLQFLNDIKEVKDIDDINYNKKIENVLLSNMKSKNAFNAARYLSRKQYEHLMLNLPSREGRLKAAKGIQDITNKDIQKNLGNKTGGSTASDLFLTTRKFDEYKLNQFSIMLDVPNVFVRTQPIIYYEGKDFTEYASIPIISVDQLRKKIVEDVKIYYRHIYGSRVKNDSGFFPNDNKVLNVRIDIRYDFATVEFYVTSDFCLHLTQIVKYLKNLLPNHQTSIYFGPAVLRRGYKKIIITYKKDPSSKTIKLYEKLLANHEYFQFTEKDESEEQKPKTH